MSNKLLPKIIIGAGSMFLVLASSAAASDMTKDEWLGKLKGVVPELICKSFLQNDELSKQFKTLNISLEKCVTFIPASFDKCKTKYYADLPATINQESASKWGRSIGECIGEDFSTKYLTASSNSGSNSGSDNPPPTSGSAKAASTSNSNEMAKEEWLGKLKAAVPDLICKGFLQDESLNKQLTKLNIDYNKCVTLIPASVAKCESQYSASMPATINESSAGKWGHAIGECIGKDFAIKYLFPDTTPTEPTKPASSTGTPATTPTPTPTTPVPGPTPTTPAPTPAPAS